MHASERGVNECGNVCLPGPVVDYCLFHYVFLLCAREISGKALQSHLIH